jgi:N-6 DNA Methylase
VAKPFTKAKGNSGARIMSDNQLQQAISRFGADAKAKLAGYSISGQPEDQLRAPLEQLIKSLGAIAGFDADDINPIGETLISGMQTRPDYAVEYQKALIGFIEVKAPGKGCDPRNFSTPHDKAQWGKLKSLPNLIYTDGNGFTLWRDGKLVGKPVLLEGGIENAGAKLAAPDALISLFADFFGWTPITPKNAKALAEVSARLCRFLRDEVLEEMEQGNSALKNLKHDWQKLLFPDADDNQFADGYAQAVTFGLLVARAYDIPLKEGIDLAALRLKKSNTLIGTALGILTGDAGSQKTLKTSISALLRVLHEVNWHEVSKDKPEAWLYFYEDFLGVYDNALKKKTGSYYTPPEVVEAMVRLVDEALRGPLFERPEGLASNDVTIADPAVGTGTFLLGILRHIAETTRQNYGDALVPGAVASASKRIFGFELQFGPFAVAQLRLLAEMRSLMNVPSSREEEAPVPEVNLYITDTLGNPFAEEEQLPQVVEAVAKSRREANKVKRGQPITVVIGNPPYKEKAEGLGGWIEAGSDGKSSPLSRWNAPKDWGIGANAKNLKNLYIYFWRWATLKVFGSGLERVANQTEIDDEGIICFISVAGFLNGPGFERMRDDLRRSCSAIWVIDCSPEGHQPDVPTRIFEGVQQTICIVLATRKKGKLEQKPARVLFHALAPGKRSEKFKELSKAASMNF